MKFLSRVILIPLCSLLLACTITLAPEYDPTLVDGLNATNEKTLTLFSALSPSATRASFSKHTQTYDALIGSFDALRVKAEARPLSPLALKLAGQMARSPQLREICGDDATACLNASPAALGEILEILRSMKEIHASSGLPEDIIGLYRGDYLISLDQALTVEMALKRN